MMYSMIGTIGYELVATAEEISMGNDVLFQIRPRHQPDLILARKTEQ